MRQTFYEFYMLHERTNLLKEWDESRNFPLTPDTVSYGSKKKVWWTCENGHSWQTTVHVRSEGSGCPYCAGRKVLPGFNDLKTLCPGVAAQWGPSLNGALTPEMVTPGSNKKVWWQCSMGHVWKSVIYPRTGAQQCGCPVCAGKVSTTHARRYAQLDEIRTFTELCQDQFYNNDQGRGKRCAFRGLTFCLIWTHCQHYV